MTKSELIGIYRTSLNCCRLTYASMILWMYEDTPSFFEALYARMEIPKPYPDLIPMRDPKVLKIACEQLYDTAHRAALKELFELTKAYCEATRQTQELKSQPWFQFWRVVRNCFSHDMRFTFNLYDRKLLPITWAGVTLDTSLDGKPLTHGRVSREKLRELLETAGAFVENGLA